MRRFPKWQTSREQLADVSLLHVMIPLVLPRRIPMYFLDFSKQVKQNMCNIQFIKLFHLKYGIYMF